MALYGQGTYQERARSMGIALQRLLANFWARAVDAGAKAFAREQVTATDVATDKQMQSLWRETQRLRTKKRL
jgi:hypothetical protein